MALTNEQMAAMLEMQDLSGMEEKLARQQALTQQLRMSALQPAANQHWTSQAARALQGIGAGYGYRQGNKMGEEIGAGRADTIRRMRDILGVSKPPAVSPAVPGAPMAGPPMGPGMEY